MRNFATEQMLLGHVNEQLSLIYSTVFDESMVNDENAGPVSEVFFTYKVEVSSDKFRKVVVRHKESNSEKEYPVIVWITEKDEYEEFVGKYTS